jgi:hypothetical protein
VIDLLGDSSTDRGDTSGDVHNQLAARQAYGDAWMQRFARGRAPPFAATATPAPPR